MSNAKPKQANGAGKKAKPSVPSTGTSTPIPSSTPTVPDSLSAFELVAYGSGRPDKALYDAEQNKIKTDIDAVQAKLSVVKDKLADGKGGPASERRKELIDELAQIRSAQGNIKQTRNKIFEQKNAIQEGVQKKIKDLNAAKAKLSFKKVADVDERIQQLHSRVESGSMKIGDEKRALAEISQLKRNRRTLEGFQTEEDAIQAERDAITELNIQLDDPEGKAMAERYDTIQAQLDELKKQSDEVHAIRGKLLDERNGLQAELDVLYNRKRESAMHYRQANDKYFAKVTEDRARRAERERAQRAADEDAKKAEIVNRLREEADVPAFQAQIEDCDTLINSFSGKPSGTLSTLSSEKEKAVLTGVAELEIRKVDAAPSDGLVVRKKKGEDEESYFAGKGKGKKGKKQGAKPASASSPAGEDAPSTSSDRLNVPLPILSALLTLSIPPPVSSADVPRLIDDLNTKKAWFLANQARVTAENKAKAEKEIERLTGGKRSKATAGNDDDDDDPPVVVDDELTPPNGNGERPAEPAPTPAVPSEPSVPVAEDEVREKLEGVEEAGEVEDAE